MTRNTKGIIFTIAGGIFWGLSGNFGQYLFEEKGLNAHWLVTVRLLSAGLIMLLTTLINSEGRKNIFNIYRDKKNIFELIMFSLLGMLGCQLTYYVTIEASNASTAIVLQYTSPVLIMMYIALKKRKMPAKSELLALFLVVLGTFFLATHGKFNSLAISKKALVWGLSSAVAVVFYNLVPVRLMNKYGTLTVLGWGMFIGGVVLSFFTKPWIVPGVWDYKTVFAFVFLVLMGTVFAFSAYLYGVRLIGAGKASLFAAAEPLTSTLVAVAVMGLVMTGMDILGFVCILIGVGVLSVWKTPDNE